MSDVELDPRALAGVQLLERTGASSFRLGYSDPDDGPPTVYWASATWEPRTAGGYRIKGTGRSEAAAGLDPVTAVLRLCEQVIDGGECTHCRQRTVFVADTDTSLLELVGCVYAWDPELATFRRGCEGDT